LGDLASSDELKHLEHLKYLRGEPEIALKSRGDGFVDVSGHLQIGRNVSPVLGYLKGSSA